MALRIKWTKGAIEDFDSILDYLNSDWNEKTINRFIEF